MTIQDQIERLKEILIQGKYDSLTEFFAGKSDGERLELADAARELYLDAFFRKENLPASVAPPVYRYADELSQAIGTDSVTPELMQKTLLDIKENEEKESVFRTYQTLAVDTVLATFSFDELKKLGLSLHMPQQFNVLLERHPSWLGEYIQFLFATNKITPYVYCEFGLHDLFELPRSADITRLIFNCIRGWEFGAPRKGNLREYALKCPRILNEEIWKFFDFPATALYAGDSGRTNAERWDETIISFGKKSILDRKRLLDLSFEKIKQSTDTPCVSWPCKVHKGLGTKPKEIMPYVESYFGWLDHANEVIARFAFDMMLIVCTENPKYDEKILDWLDIPLREKTKERAKKTVDLLAVMIDRSGALRERILDKIMLALEHDATDIQAAAMKLLAKQPEFQSLGIIERLKNIAPLLAASVRDQIPKVSQEQPTTVPKATQKSPVTWKPAPIIPIQTLEEFIDAAVHVLEVPESMDEVERLLDFMARTVPERNDEFNRQTSALAKRAIQTFSKKDFVSRFQITPDFTKKFPHIIDLDGRFPFIDGFYPYNCMPRNDIGSTIHVWLFGKMPEMVAEGELPRQITLFKIGEFILGGNIYCTKELKPTLGNLFRIRVEALARRIANEKSHPLLSTPTHQYGWIDPRVLVERLRDFIEKPDDYDKSDQVLTLTRLSPEHRSEALANVPKSDNEYIDAVRYALGADDVKIGPTPGFWVSAARSRNPLGDDRKVESVHSGYGPDAAIAATYRFETDYVRKIKIRIHAEPKQEPRVEHIDMPSVLLHFEMPISLDAPKLSIDWASSVWPSQLDPVFSHPIPTLGYSIDKPGSLIYNELFFGPLFRPTLRFRENALMLLAVGLCHKNPEVHLPAVDIIIAAIDEERFETESFVKTIRILFDAGLARPPRLAKNLAEIARQSLDHGEVIRRLLELTLAVELKADHNPLLELLLELCIEAKTTVQSSELRKILDDISSSGKTGKLAKKLLELQ